MGKLHYQEPPSEDEKKAFAKFLAEDEELIVAAGFGKAYLRSKFVMAILLPGAVFLLGGIGLALWQGFNLGYGLLLGLVIAGVAAFFKTVLLYHANRYILTTRRVIIKRGLIAVKITSALYDKITHIEVDQSFVDKIFMHHGMIIINTAGTNKDEIVLRYIDYPIEFKNLLERLINREREQFGLRSGPVVTLEGEVV